MTSTASQPTQTQTDSTQSKDAKNATTSTKFDVPVPVEQILDDNETVVGTDESPETENKFRSSVEKLRDAIEGYNTAIAQNADEKTIEMHEQKVIQALKETAESSPNPKVKEYYKEKALEFMKVGRTAKKVLTNDIIKGALFILASPVALLSSVVVKFHFLLTITPSHCANVSWKVSTGGLVYGLGSVVKGVGDLMSGMTFSGTVLGSKDEPKAEKKDAGVQNEEQEEDKEEEDKQEDTAVGEEKEDEAEGENTTEDTTTDKADRAE
ncbi:uncharacterized protein C8R40DRAFT_1164558 [Lentinula edodes]|uniref:uncharacterized protein n=1 Tax=Lentinula edodes TaxID=5353 RepID=UPI001E8E5546|nr:uncharacterized protein C8R40DRAFT_1164558 [Lentinula edodes]KAH7881145.1 hypothetical protein C8R40DRAFT_1164558 [Lentinula edodes]